MTIRTTAIVAGSVLLSWSGIAAAQEAEPSAAPPKSGDEVEIEVKKIPPGEDVIIETRVRRVPSAQAQPAARSEIQRTSLVEEEPPPPPMRRAVVETDGDEMGRPDLVTEIGVGLTAGGGVNDFTNESIRDSTAIGGGWDVRLTIGTRTIIAGELAYVGTARDIEAIGLDENAFMSSNGGETAARINFLSGIVQPYVLGGVGFTHYQIHNADFNTSAVDEDDTQVHFPVGGGLGLRYEGVMVDARGMFRPVTDDNMFGEDEAMHTWDAKLSAGLEF